MTENRFTMVSEWMTNGNINEFVKAHQNANRFELVSHSLKLLTSSLIVYDFMTLVVGRYREWFDPYARARNDPWRPQGGMSSEP